MLPLGPWSSLLTLKTLCEAGAGRQTPPGVSTLSGQQSGDHGGGKRNYTWREMTSDLLLERSQADWYSQPFPASVLKVPKEQFASEVTCPHLLLHPLLPGV